jgi:hypothetical protein
MRTKLLLSYDVLPSTQEAYYQFVTNELLPQAQDLGLIIAEAWHTTYGNYPMRLTGFIAEDLATMKAILSSKEWQRLEAGLKQYVNSFSKKVVPYRNGFQI